MPFSVGMTNAKISRILELISSISSRSQLPLNALRVFEAAARRSSFRDAAEELHVTASAVSHQIRGLEDELGLRLFERQPRKVQLTEAGRKLLVAATRAFDELATALETIQPVGSAVVVSATPAFAARWLLPRLSRFHDEHQDINLRLETSTKTVDLKSAGVDLAIRYGRGPYPHLQTEVLMHEQFLAVARPDYAARHPDFEGATLLQIAWASAVLDPIGWDPFFSAAGLSPRVIEGPIFDDESHAILAALAGQGVVLASDVLVSEELARGSLVAVGHACLPGLAYHLVTAPGSEHLQSIRAVSGWLRHEAKEPVRAVSS